MDTTDDVLKETIDMTNYIMAEWLKFPKNQSLVALQAGFVTTLMEITGSNDILLLDSTWKAYLHPKTQLFGKRKVNLTMARMAEMTESLKNHNIAIAHGNESLVIKEIGDLHHSYAPWTPSRRTDILSSAIQTFLEFLRALDPILDNPDRLDSDTDLFKKVKTDQDFYLPFREHAPSRIRIRSDLGPFQSEYIKTRSGIFSALIYRGVTYRAAAERDPHNNRFDNPEAWTTYYQGLTGEHIPLLQRKPDSYFSNQRAYGTPNHTRKPEQAVKYWEGTADWEEFLSRGKPTFAEMQEYLQRVDQNG